MPLHRGAPRAPTVRWKLRWALRRDDDVADPPCAGGLRRSVAMPRHGVTRTATRTGNLGRGGGKVWKVYDDEHSDHQKIR